jgi:hypothetical protein
LYEHYTGHGIYYEVSHESDVFLFVGQPTSGIPMNDSSRDWLATKLEEHKGRRCFVFVHSFIDESWTSSPTEVADVIKDSGNPCNARGNSLFGYWGAAATTKFMDIMKRYDKAVLFHGHNHMMFEAQEFDKNANYTNRNGFHSVHVPSIGNPRKLLKADGSWDDKDESGNYYPAEAYLVDVYEDCVVLNGLSYAEGEWVPSAVGTYRIGI